MKRIYLLLVVMVGLLMVPNMVEAEAKKIGDIVYTMETNSIYDYLCDDLAGHEVSVGTYESDKLLVYDHTDSGKQYLVDLEKKASCTEINPSYVDEEFYIDYVWKENNSLYLEFVDSDYETYFVKTSDTEVDDTKDYYVNVIEEFEGGFTEHFELVDIPSEENIDEYFESFFFELADGEFVSGEVYYKSVDGSGSQLEVVEGLDENNYNSGEYFILGKNIKRELLAKFSSNEFKMSKDVSGMPNDVIFTSDDFMYHFVLGEKNYFVFNSFDENGDFVASGVFNEKGEYETFGHDKFSFRDASESEDGYVSIVAEIDGKNTLLIYDQEVNLIFSEESDAVYSHMVLSTEEVEYMVRYDENNDVFIVKLNKHYLMTEGELKYGGSDIVVKFSGEASKLTSVKVDDVVLDKNNYTVESGSTVLTLKNTYLSTLKDGEYKLKVEYSDGGYVETVFTIGKVVNSTTVIDNPDTFDNGINLLVVTMISLMGLIGTTVYLKKLYR